MSLRGRQQEDLLNERHRTQRRLAQAVGLGRDRAPREHRQPFLGRHLFHHGPGLQGIVLSLGKNARPTA